MFYKTYSYKFGHTLLCYLSLAKMFNKRSCNLLRPLKSDLSSTTNSNRVEAIHFDNKITPKVAAKFEPEYQA